MNTSLSLGYSTCPNDTLAFYALAHHQVDCRGIDFRIELADVETLNQKAKEGVLDITKLSVAALGNLSDRYTLLRSGGALGRGCGPLLVARPGTTLDALLQKPVAVPGMWTTAALLLGLYAPHPPQMFPMSFDRIMPSIQEGRLDIGVIIHEGRFTYGNYGLTCLLDLGAWWEETTGMPIPLGCIAARRDLGPDIIRKVEETIRDSVIYGLNDRNKAMPYIRAHAQEMMPEVIHRHIDLYVNDFTIDLKEDGAKAIDLLLRKGQERGLLPKSRTSLFQDLQ